MKRVLYLVLLGSVILASCAPARLSHDEARKKIVAIAESKLIPDAIEIRRIVSQTDTQAIAEATITLAFQFKRPNSNSDWKIDAVRLGDRDWISLDQLLAAINDTRRQSTSDSMQQIAAGIERYQNKNNGTLPSARDIVALTDTLHPSFLTTLIREDGWGNPIIYETTGNSAYRLVSPGADGLRGTTDDVVVEKMVPAAP